MLLFRVFDSRGFPGFFLMEAYHHGHFVQQVEQGLATVRTLLNASRDPTIPESVHHTYSDK
jgi:hypothetical protein